MSRHALLPLIPLTVACSGTLLEDGFESQLTLFGGCGDTFLHASNADGSIGVQLLIDGPVAAAGTVETTTTYTLPDASVTLAAFEGQAVDQRFCNDVIDDNTRVDLEWGATEGELTLTVRPNATVDEAPRVDAVLEGVQFEAGDRAVRAGTIEWSDVAVGWLPG